MTEDEIQQLWRLYAMERDAAIVQARADFNAAVSQAESDFATNLGERIIARLAIITRGA